jgi:hypothetical protein
MEFLLFLAISASAKSRVLVVAARLAATQGAPPLESAMRALGAVRNLLCGGWRFAVLCWREHEHEVRHDACNESPVF